MPIRLVPVVPIALAAPTQRSHPTATRRTALLRSEVIARAGPFKATLEKKGVAGEWSCEREGGRKF